MNIELTEKMIDAPRQFLSLYKQNRTVRTEEMRKHLDLSGVDYQSCWPEWALTGDVDITKAGAAILILHMMLANSDTPDPGTAAIKYALGMDSQEDSLTFLGMWRDGLFPEIRQEFHDVPDEVFIGADPLFKKD